MRYFAKKISKSQILPLEKILQFLEPVNRHLEGDDVRILGDGDVAEVGYFIINC